MPEAIPRGHVAGLLSRGVCSASGLLRVRQKPPRWVRSLVAASGTAIPGAGEGTRRDGPGRPPSEGRQ